MTPKLLSKAKLAFSLLIAMTCVSCAHQTRNADLMLDKSTPSEEHVWSESREIQEAVAAAESKPEETELEEATSQDSVSIETSVSEASEKSELVASADAVTDLPDKSQQGSTMDSEAKSDVPREVANEPPSDEVVPPSRVEPTIGVPGRLKNHDNFVPSKKFNEKNRSSSNQEPNQAVSPNHEKNIEAKIDKPMAELILNTEAREKALADSSEPTVNALGEEESSPQLASVEIANFVQRHWFASLLMALVGFGALYFTVGRKKNEDSQTI